MDSNGSMESSSSSWSCVVPVDNIRETLVQVVPSSNQEWHKSVSEETHMNHLEKLVRAMLPTHCLTEGVVEEKILKPLCYTAGILESRTMDLAQSVEEYSNDIAKHIIDTGIAAEMIWARGQLSANQRLSGAENDLQVPGCSGQYFQVSRNSGDSKASGSSGEDPKASGSSGEYSKASGSPGEDSKLSSGEDSKLSSGEESNVSSSTGDHQVSGSPGDDIQVCDSSAEYSLVFGSSGEDYLVSGISEKDSLVSGSSGDDAQVPSSPGQDFEAPNTLGQDCQVRSSPGHDLEAPNTFRHDF